MFGVLSESFPEYIDFASFKKLKFNSLERYLDLTGKIISAPTKTSYWGELERPSNERKSQQSSGTTNALHGVFRMITPPWCLKRSCESDTPISSVFFFNTMSSSKFKKPLDPLELPTPPPGRMLMTWLFFSHQNPNENWSPQTPAKTWHALLVGISWTFWKWMKDMKKALSNCRLEQEIWNFVGGVFSILVWCIFFETPKNWEIWWVWTKAARGFARDFQPKTGLDWKTFNWDEKSLWSTNIAIERWKSM